MDETKNVDLFIKDYAISANEESIEKFVGWESLIAILIYQGIRIMLPEIKEWLKLGAQVIALKRQEIKKKLVDYALEKELDFLQAEQAAEIISHRLNEKTLKDIIEVFER